ncbi:hypothetical protein BCU85_07475 [Vibrio lentus]|uniref:Uncharacterized protein n=1 Tax=Vibrio lentus TaxID=136468 RepID=A0A855IM82_9VIBR|nr:hypothetical protein BCV23_10890 [Vibrio lentus]PMF76131.1 hypothetical protein BCV10_19030 [Vibrio lentus]PMG61891.1 hypothetical protein BCU87_12995 [Vibrio lentus]PMG69232.1 hypothetical protein BCU85_07475 [Vibrio lentus]PMG95642.1 hypothetical protein BCU78_08740 [Vibrio lentus]
MKEMYGADIDLPHKKIREILASGDPFAIEAFISTLGAYSRCHPYTTATTLWEAGHDNPVTGDNFGFVQWRKRNCVFL